MKNLVLFSSLLVYELSFAQFSNYSVRLENEQTWKKLTRVQIVDTFDSK
ncbi:MAG: hypothetical protein ACK50Y_01215 [Flavobacteriia bacterium]